MRRWPLQHGAGVDAHVRSRECVHIVPVITCLPVGEVHYLILDLIDGDVEVPRLLPRSLYTTAVTKYINANEEGARSPVGYLSSALMPLAPTDGARQPIRP